MKKLVLIILSVCIGCSVFAQTDTNTQQADTSTRIRPVILPKPIKRRTPADSIIRKKRLDTVIVVDSTVKKDSFASATSDTIHTAPAADTTSVITKPIVVKRPIDSFYLKLLDNPFLRSKEKPIFLVINERKRVSKDEMFYLILGLLFFLAFIKLVFSKFFQNIFKLFFQPSFRQKQTREQLQQGNLPSLLLNLFFVFSAAAYISFLLEYYHITDTGFWLLFLYSSLSLMVLYAGKYIFLSFAGWVFNVKEATDSYIFAIYLINKIIGVVLVPFTLVVAFSKADIINTSITISILLIFLLFLYRYLISYGAVRREVKVSPLHFFFYIIAFEITPLLLIYKTLMLYLNKSL